MKINFKIRMFLLLLVSGLLSYIFLSEVLRLPGQALLKKHGVYIPYHAMYFGFLLLALYILEILNKLDLGLKLYLLYGIFLGHFLGGLALLLSYVIFDPAGLGWAELLNSLKMDFWGTLFFYTIGSAFFLGWLNGLVTATLYFYFKKYLLSKFH